MLDGESAKSSVVKYKLIHQKDFSVNKAYISVYARVGFGPLESLQVQSHFGVYL